MGQFVQVYFGITKAAEGWEERLNGRLTTRKSIGEPDKHTTRRKNIELVLGERVQGGEDP
jgi:hypothetical protein